MPALANGPQHPIDGLRLARASGAAEKHVLRFQHPGEDDAADFNIHVGRLGLVAVHAGLQIAAAYDFRAAHDGFLTVRRIVRAGDIVTP